MVTSIDCDVLVVGGGAAGIAAAVAAARSGSRTVLLESYGFLGGLATAGMVGTVCGIYHRSVAGDVRYVCGGFPREWTERLAEACSSQPVEVLDGLYALPYDPWAFARLADAVVGEEAGLQLVLHGVLTAAETRQGRVAEARALVWNREVVIRPASLVDCTGEATAVRLAGGRVEEAGHSQAAAVVFCMEPVHADLRTRAGRVAALHEITRAVRAGRLDPTCEAVSFLTAPAHTGRICVKLALPVPAKDDWNAMTALEARGRELVEQLARFLTRETSAFEGARLSRTASQVGIRVGNRVRGLSTLTEQDVLHCNKFSDGVACGAWPTEVWSEGRRPEIGLLPEGEHYEIPVGCLIVEGLGNVFAAGRCISAEPRALASARVIGTALATGWAAGTVAARRAAGRPLDEVVARLREEQVTGLAAEDQA